MRCKNCGLDNDENLYICQNCGSPLYDEADFEDNDDNQKTKEISKVIATPTPAKAEEAPEDKKKMQLNILIIALCVVLVAIIVGIVAVVASNNDEDETTTQISTTTQEDTTQSSTTTTEPTTEITTETTTTTTTTATTTTTEATMLNVLISNNAGGSVQGAGKYKRGEHITVTATPDDGYEFDGWYSGNTLLSTAPSYTFTVTKDTQLQAIFAVVQEETEETTKPIDMMDGEYD